VDNYGEGFTATGTINVQIINENDMPPAFSKSEYVSTIQEGNQKLDSPIFINVSRVKVIITTFRTSSHNEKTNVEERIDW